MRDEEMENNRAWVTGRLVPELRYSHKMYGERFFRADMLVSRASGIKDIVPLMVPERIAEAGTDYSDSAVEVTGQFRSYNRKEDGRSRLELSLFVQGIHCVDGGCMDYEKNNRISLKGFLCKAPVYRKTPFGRRICDILLAVNRPHGKSDYIPCIVWGKDAKTAGKLEVGKCINIRGRIQSREYRKWLSEEESEIRVAYEISVNMLQAEQGP